MPTNQADLLMNSDWADGPDVTEHPHAISKAFDEEGFRDPVNHYMTQASMKDWRMSDNVIDDRNPSGPGQYDTTAWSTATDPKASLNKFKYLDGSDGGTPASPNQYNWVSANLDGTSTTPIETRMSEYKQKMLKEVNTNFNRDRQGL